MKKVIELNKSESKSILAILDWFEYQYKLGKTQERARAKILEQYPELEELEQETK